MNDELETRFDETEEKSVYGEEAQEFLINATHFVLFLENRDGEDYVMHTVGYQQEPDQHNLNMLIEEVRTDPEFGLGDLMDKLEVVVVSDPEGLEYIKREILELKDDWELPT